MTDTAELELVSTGELARRLGRSQAGVRQLEAQGLIPRSIMIIGSGRRVWRLEDVPAIERANRKRSQQPRREAPSDV